MLFKNKLLFYCCVVLVPTVQLTAQKVGEPKWVKQNANGELSYQADELGNTIPDFSRVGYYHGFKDIPMVPLVRAIEPSDSAEQEIQTAINQLSEAPINKNGFRGCIFIRAGTFKIKGTIKIAASGIVLRGQGDATKIIAVGKGQRTLISVSGSGGIKQDGPSIQITDKYVPVGAHSFNVVSTKNLKVGDKIIIYRPSTKKWISDLKMDQIEVRDTGTKQWDANDFGLSFEREITAIDSNRIFIDNPIVMAMEEKYGGGQVYAYYFSGRINNVGIEFLNCESEYSGDTDEDHGWNAVQFNRVENGWVRNVTSKYFGYSCVNLGSYAKNITVNNCQCLDAKSQVTGGRRYSFNNDGQQNLIMNCFASEGRHDYVTGAKVCGPNVFYNCKAEKTHADIGPHHRWAVGTLYDNITTDGEINIQDRGNWGTGHGWSGVTQVVWNCTASKAAIQNPYVSGMNYVIGLKATGYEGRLKGRPQTEWENVEGTLQPSSLFIEQRKQLLKNKK
jgi:hypothetical protein